MFIDKIVNGLIIDKIEANVQNGFLLKVLTDEGLLFIKAKGIKKPESKNRISTEIGVFSELEILVSNNTYLLKRATSLNDYLIKIRTNSIIYKKIIEIFSLINEKNNNFLNWFKVVMQEINNFEDEIQFIQTYLVSKILEDKGIQLLFDKCVFCKSNQKLSFFSFADGGMLCFDHANNKKTNLKELKTFYFLSKDYQEFFSLGDYQVSQIVFSKLKNFIIQNS
ncbi:MAG: DNA repair protein RecO [Metamycoplasmataceae bacterium]